jgi:V8-like Glu-specific endopeptidase
MQLAASTLAITLALGGTAALAQDGPIGITNPNVQVDPRGPDGHWNAAAFADAQDQPLPIPEASFLSVVRDTSGETGMQIVENGRFADEQDQISADVAAMIVEPRIAPKTGPLRPEAVGTMGAYFTSSQLVPEDARLSYPYRLNGKIFFTEPDTGDFICSGTVLRPRLILTAGHCVHAGRSDAEGFYTNFLFIPAYHSGNAPYQAWSWSWVGTTASWKTSNGDVPNEADFAIIEVQDREFDGEMKRIGDVVGWAGYRTGALSPNHTKKIGYPGNLDRGEVMHQVDSAWFKDADRNTVLYGSDMGGGSSGGGWFENFGVKAEGQEGAMFDSPNRIVGVTSYGFVDDAPKVQGSSRMGEEFITLLNLACNHQAGNC